MTSDAECVEVNIDYGTVRTFDGSVEPSGVPIRVSS
jgi:hypothetical protein